MDQAADIPEAHLGAIFQYGSHPLWLYLKHVFNIDIVDVCSRVTSAEPVLATDFGNIVARVVDVSYATKLPSTFNSDVMFLINSVNAVFDFLKSGVERDGIKLLEPFRFEKDEYNKIYLVRRDTKEPISDIAISVVLFE